MRTFSVSNGLIHSIRAKATETSFSGVLSVDAGKFTFEGAFGQRDRANKLENTCETRFGIASGTKGFTALGIAALIEDGKLALDTAACSVVGDMIRNVHPEVTIRQLLQHTSGVGDHFDEEEIRDGVDDFVLAIPVQNLRSPSDYIPLLEEKPQKFPPGQRACYSNGGYVLLAIIIEVISSKTFPEVIEERVFARAGMERTGFFRSDCLPDNTAGGYIGGGDNLRTNVFNLPVIGSGDGGSYSTLEDMRRFWSGLKSARIVGDEMRESMWQARSRLGSSWYGYGFWIDKERDLIALEGYDAGVSFYSATSRTADHGFTVISNTKSGVWPMVKLIKDEMV